MKRLCSFSFSGRRQRQALGNITANYEMIIRLTESVFARLRTRYHPRGKLLHVQNVAVPSSNRHSGGLNFAPHVIGSPPSGIGCGTQDKIHWPWTWSAAVRPPPFGHLNGSGRSDRYACPAGDQYYHEWTPGFPGKGIYVKGEPAADQQHLCQCVGAFRRPRPKPRGPG